MKISNKLITDNKERLSVINYRIVMSVHNRTCRRCGLDKLHYLIKSVMHDFVKRINSFFASSVVIGT